MRPARCHPASPACRARSGLAHARGIRSGYTNPRSTPRGRPQSGMTFGQEQRSRKMPWEQRTVRYWTTCYWEFSYPCGIKWCRKWGVPYPCGIKTCKGNLPYPCRKTKIVFCCTGVHRVRCYGLYGEHWHCCDGRESKWWGKCWGLGNTVESNVTMCRDSIPNESQGCPNTVGDAPPIELRRTGTVRSTGLGIAVGLAVGSMVASVTDAGIHQGLIGGATVGAVFGAGTGRRWGPPMTLLALMIVLAAYRFVTSR